MTDNIIYYNIDKSPYVYKTVYFDFYFSSQFYLNKFKREVYDYIDIEQNKLKVKFRHLVSFERILMLDYYTKVEKRGFKVYDKLKEKFIENDYKIWGDLRYD